MSPRRFGIVLVALLVAAHSATAATEWPSCDYGTANMKMSNVEDQPPVCTTEGAANFTLPCLLSIKMTVKDCGVLLTSNINTTDAGFACNAVYFSGNMTAANSAKLKGGLYPSVSIGAFCGKYIETCLSLGTLAESPVIAWREKNVLYVAASPSCTYTYAIDKEDADLLAGSNVTPTGSSKASRGGEGLVLATSPAASNSSSGANSSTAKPPPASPAPSSGSKLQTPFATFALLALAALAVVVA